MSLLRTAAILTAAAAVALPMTAGAVNIVNEDSQDHTVQVTQGGASQQVTVRAGQTVQNVCGAGCLILLEVDEVVAESGDETAYIRQGGELTTLKQ